MTRRISFLACSLASSIAALTAKPDASPPANSNIVWDSPSADAKGSMPLGNGDIGANAWVESNGDLVLLVGKSDSFDEFNRLLKLGRIRIKTTPALFQAGQSFSQTLRLEDGSIGIATDTAKLRVWADANHPVVQVDCQSPAPLAAQILLENWRKEPRELMANERHSLWGNWPDKMRVNADTILPAKPAQLAWCHHNVESQWKRNLELTALGDEVAKGKDPILNRSFGAVIRAAGFTAASDTELKSAAPATSFSVSIVPLTTFADSPEAWLTQAEKTADAVPASTPNRFTAHRKWWRDFWSRSWIEVSGSGDQPVPTATFPGKLSLGIDTRGGNPFRGTIADPVSIPRALTNEEIANLAKAPHGESPAKDAPDVSLHGDFTLAAWIKPAEGERGRIFDKSTPTKADGLLFDTEPGDSLRYDLGGSLIKRERCLKPGVWQHAAATFNSKTGEQRLYLDGRLLESRMQESDANRVTRAYALQRFVTACAGRGSLPVKFNGSLFTVDGPDPDYRAWGGGYWWQNTREAYWSMLYAGDYEMMEPLFRMYREALPLRMAATRKYYQHEGAFYPETMYLWGNYMDNENYGIDRKGKADGMCDNGYIRRYWQSGLELVAMMLDAHDGTLDPVLRDKTLLPIARQITLFYDQHWQRGTDGKILFDPAQSLETWHTAKNPLPEIAGLRFILPRLLELPAEETTKTHWRRLLEDLPPVPVKTENNQTRLMPAETFGDKKNMENPELYGVFPYRVHTTLSGEAGHAMALNAWRVRRHPEDHGWQQNCIQAPLLGLAAEAKAMIAARAAKTAGYRFPGFFGPNYDWTPEQCHGTNMMTGLQRMLMQCEGKRIVLLPAWPKDWNASFKLHAPHRTTVEARIVEGKVLDLKVTPESRRKDVEIRQPSAL